MCETMRIFGLLLYKNWLTRKRKLIPLLIQIVFALGFVYLINVMNISHGPAEAVDTDSRYPPVSLNSLIDNVTAHGIVPILFAPEKKFTVDLMGNVNKCFKNRSHSEGFATEDALLSYHYGAKDFYGVAVIFDAPIDRVSKRLRYKIRSIGSPSNLYNDKSIPTNITLIFEQSIMTQIQICLDRSFVSLKSRGKPLPDMYIQRMPYPPNTQPKAFNEQIREVAFSLLLYACMFPLITETLKTMSEKFAGVNVLMAMNGISNAMNLLSWLISGLIIWSVLFALPAVWLLSRAKSYGSAAFFHYSDFKAVYLVFVCYLAHLIAYGIHVSAYFSSKYAVIIVLFFCHFLPENVNRNLFDDDTRYLAPYVGLLMPNLLFTQAMREIGDYETRTEGIQWYNLFLKSSSKVGGSLGMILILSAIGAIVHYLLAVYVYAVKPGKYGVAKHPLYFLNCLNCGCGGNDEIEMESFQYDRASDEYFEASPQGIYEPGIQIRNLKKTYRLNLFSFKKVRALRGISVDFYKGQITALLGHNGAGKTTMMSILTGMISPTDGLVLVNSKNLKYHAREIANDMGLCPQENMCFSRLSVQEQLLFFALVKRKGESVSVIQKDVRTLLESLKLFDKRNSLPITLSGGQVRRLCLAMALVGNSSILILDEPTSGLDPETRRVIWDILLRMRGQKTILISTHDMEEADILGDKIAIMHTGELKSYGTSLFLKKLIGQNNVEITCSVAPGTDPEKIRKEIHKDSTISHADDSRIVIIRPNTPNLPDSLDSLQKRKSQLGISGFSVAIMSLEQVFLKMTEENEESTIKHDMEDDYEETKLTGCGLCFQRVYGLLMKKLSYTLRSKATIIYQILTIIVALLFHLVLLSSFEAVVHAPAKIVPIHLDMYANPQVLYTSRDQSFADTYNSVCQKSGGHPSLVTDTYLENALLNYARRDLKSYDNYMIAAAEFNKSSVNAFYSETAIFSLPVSINLIYNAIIKNLVGPLYSISLSSQALPNRSLATKDVSQLIGLILPIFFGLSYLSALVLFVMHPSREFQSGVKHLQKMTGVSDVTYWASMYVIDLFLYVLLALFICAAFYFFDLLLDTQLYGQREISIETALFVLLGINALPFLYCLCFLNKDTGSLVAFAIMGTVLIVVVDLVMAFFSFLSEQKGSTLSLRPMQKKVFLLMPYVSFMHGHIAFTRTLHANARCRKLPNEFYKWCRSPEFVDVCCGFNCFDGVCQRPKQFFGEDQDKEFCLETSFQYLCLTPLLYFVVLALLESRLIQKLTATSRLGSPSYDSDSDEQVQREKLIVYERIQQHQGIRSNRPSTESNRTQSSGQSSRSNSTDDVVFLVYELEKTYSGFRAVKDVTFRVNNRECFGLLGVNGAGKTTTFKMMTGRELADSGVMFIGDKEFAKNEKYFMSRMGYCPQHDAIMSSMNSYEHLGLFARLRGIPEKRVKNVVRAWIDKMNLNACARRPSGTYSGGNKRRLNIAMALIGNPSLVLMDEPTTGVDPRARRSLWNVIKACQASGQAVILTSHSMDECEALCNRLAIMVNGQLVCVGASEELKQRFGAGYDIQIKLNPEKAIEQADKIKEDMNRSLNCVLIDGNWGHQMYHVAPSGTTWRKMYDVMNRLKKKYDGIEDFLVVSATLERLFLLFAKAATGGHSLRALESNSNESVT